MPAVSKRNTTSKTSAPKRAKVTLTPLEKQAKKVASLLENNETVVPGPASCRTMLLEVVPAALKVPKAERHEHQDAVICMVREIFDNEKDRWNTRIVDAQSALENANAVRAEKVEIKDASEHSLKQQKDDVNIKLQAQSKAMETIEECKEEHSGALKLLKKAETVKEELIKTRAHDLSVQEAITGLKAGSYENPKEVKSNIAAITKLFESLGAEEALVKTLPQILRRKPEERGSFDDMALQQLDVYMNNNLNVLNSKIEDADKIVEEHTIAATAWDAALEVAEDKKLESDKALEAAETLQHEMQEALNCARKALKEHTAAVKRCDTNLCTEQIGLHAVELALEALDFCQEYVVPEPEVDEEMKEPEQPVINETDQTLATEVSVAPVEITSSKAKEIEVTLDIEDFPSPSKKARRSLTGASSMVVV